jgi:hypothetical protein
MRHQTWSFLSSRKTWLDLMDVCSVWLLWSDLYPSQIESNWIQAKFVFPFFTFTSFSKTK